MAPVLGSRLVPQLVLFLIPFRCKSGVAMLTFKWFLAGMKKLMRPYILDPFKCPSTWFFLRLDMWLIFDCFDIKYVHDTLKLASKKFEIK